MAKFADIFEEIKNKVVDLAKTEVKDYADTAVSDAKNFLEMSKNNLQRWTNAMVDHHLTPEEFADLANSQLALGEMKALTNIGLAQIKVDKFKNTVIHLVIDTIMNRIKI